MVKSCLWQNYMYGETALGLLLIKLCLWQQLHVQVSTTELIVLK